jgi:hypothetical protein
VILEVLRAHFATLRASHIVVEEHAAGAAPDTAAREANYVLLCRRQHGGSSHTVWAAMINYEGGPDKSRFSWDPLTTLVAVRGPPERDICASVNCRIAPPNERWRPHTDWQQVGHRAGVRREDKSTHHFLCDGHALALPQAKCV